MTCLDILFVGFWVGAISRPRQLALLDLAETQKGTSNLLAERSFATVTGSFQPCSARDPVKIWYGSVSGDLSVINKTMQGPATENDCDSSRPRLHKLEEHEFFPTMRTGFM